MFVCMCVRACVRPDWLRVAGIIFAAVFADGALRAAQDAGAGAAWGLMQPLGANPSHLAASFNVASSVSLSWTGLAVVSGCATLPSLSLPAKDAANWAFQTSIVAVPLGLLAAIAVSGVPLPPNELSEAVVAIPLSLVLWRAGAAWFLFG